MDSDLISQLKPFIWAKSNPFKPLREHLLETGFIAQTLILEGCFSPLKTELMYQTGLSSDEIINLTGYLASTHDLGKIESSFVGSGAYEPAKIFLDQHDLNCKINLPFRHEKYGAACLRRIWKEKNRFTNRSVLRNLSYIIENHHQGKRGDAGPKPEGSQDVWSILQE